jgi:peptidoglycan/xylan/chitin deacetylase (PgdA/CDA1 family)
VIPVPILLYHSVGDVTSGPLGPYTMSIPAFKDQMAWIADQGYQTMTVSTFSSVLRGQARLPERPLLITFDDGLADFLDNALPVLSSRGHACTMFVTTAATWRSKPRALGGRPTLSWSQVTTLAQSGVEIGGHSHEHLQLDLLSAAKVREQIKTCKDQLEAATTSEVTSFAYPHGYNRAATRRLVEEFGFTSACAVRNETSHARDEPMALARIMLTSGQSVRFLDWALTRSSLPLARPKQRLRRSAWRAVRLMRTRGRPLITVTDL